MISKIFPVIHFCITTIIHYQNITHYPIYFPICCGNLPLGIYFLFQIYYFQNEQTTS